MHKAFKEAGPTHAASFIRICRVKKTREEKGLLSYTLSELKAEPAVTDPALHRIMTALGGDVRQGTAPPSELERTLQKDVDALNQQLGKKKKN